MRSLESVSDAIFKEIEHGDEEHRAWLKEALDQSPTLNKLFKRESDITLFDFSEALKYIKQGKYVTRFSWQNSKQWLFLSKGQFDGPYLGFTQDGQPDNNHPSTIDGISLGLFENKGSLTTIKYPRLSMMMDSGCILEGWIPNHVDLLATDYKLL
jgi:hypothetical protein